jgi:hypothetical protein
MGCFSFSRDKTRLKLRPYQAIYRLMVTAAISRTFTQQRMSVTQIFVYDIVM